MPPNMPPIHLPGVPEYDIGDGTSGVGKIQALAAAMQGGGKFLGGGAMDTSGPTTSVTPSVTGNVGSGATGLPGFPGLPGAPSEARPMDEAPMEGSPAAGAIRTASLPRTQAIFSTNNKWLKNMSVASSILQDVSNIVTGFKQKKWDQTRQSSASFLSKYIGLAQMSSQENLTEDQKAAIQEQMQTLVSDEKFQKAWDKANKDPNSPEYIGFSQAQKQAQQQAGTVLAMNQLSAQIEHAKALAAQQSESAALMKQEKEYRTTHEGFSPGEVASMTEAKARAASSGMQHGQPFKAGPNQAGLEEGAWYYPMMKDGKIVGNERIQGTPVGGLDTVSVSQGEAAATVQGPGGREMVVRVPVTSVTTKSKGGVPPIAKATRQAAGQANKQQNKVAPPGKPKAQWAPGLPPGTRVIGFKGLSELQRYKLEQNLNSVDTTVGLVDDILAKKDVFNSLWSSGKVALAVNPNTLWHTFSRATDLTPEETEVAVKWQQMQEHINILREPLMAAGFRGQEAWGALQALHGQVMADPKVTVGVLQDVRKLMTKIGDTNRKYLTGAGDYDVSGGGEKKKDTTQTGKPMPKMRIEPGGAIVFE